MSFYIVISLILMIFNSILYICGRPRVEQHFSPIPITGIEMMTTITVGSLMPGVRWVFTIGMFAIATGRM